MHFDSNSVSISMPGLVWNRGVLGLREADGDAR